MFGKRWWIVPCFLGLALLLTGCAENLFTPGVPEDDKKSELSTETISAINQSIMADSDFMPLDFARTHSGSLSGRGAYDMWQSNNVVPGHFEADLFGPSNTDFDLYVKVGSRPTVSDYDSRGYTSSSQEHCYVTIASQAIVYVMVRSYSGSGNYTLEVKNVGSEPSQEILAESPHPYTNNYTNTWTISSPGSTQVRIHFSRLETEDGYDYVYIYDKNNHRVKTYDGSHNDTWTPWVDGDRITVKLQTDYSVTAYGFIVDRKEVRTEEPVPDTMGYIKTGSVSSYGILQSKYLQIHIDAAYAEEIVNRTAVAASTTAAIVGYFAGGVPGAAISIAGILDGMMQVIVGFSPVQEATSFILLNDDGSMDIFIYQVFGDLVEVKLGRFQLNVPPPIPTLPYWLLPGFSDITIGRQVSIPAPG